MGRIVLAFPLYCSVCLFYRSTAPGASAVAPENPTRTESPYSFRTLQVRVERNIPHRNLPVAAYDNSVTHAQSQYRRRVTFHSQFPSFVARMGLACAEGVLLVGSAYACVETTAAWLSISLTEARSAPACRRCAQAVLRVVRTERFTIYDAMQIAMHYAL